jgi:type IX secretion system PorP/SprF family membrane protein
MKKLFLFLVAILLIEEGFCQQVPLFTQYFRDPFIYNPAMTGSSGFTNMFLIHHSQWTDMPGGPITRGLTVDGSIMDRKMGIGGSIFNDVTDITNTIGGYGSYSYRIHTSDNSALLFGISLGIMDKKINFAKAVVNDLDDQALFNQMESATSFDGTAGLAFLLGNLELGFAVPQITGSKLKFTDNDTRTFYSLSRHYVGSVKYSFDLSECSRSPIPV